MWHSLQLAVQQSSRSCVEAVVAEPNVVLATLAILCVCYVLLQPYLRRLSELRVVSYVSLLCARACKCFAVLLWATHLVLAQPAVTSLLQLLHGVSAVLFVSCCMLIQLVRALTHALRRLDYPAFALIFAIPGWILVLRAFHIFAATFSLSHHKTLVKCIVAWLVLELCWYLCLLCRFEYRQRLAESQPTASHKPHMVRTEESTHLHITNGRWATPGTPGTPGTFSLW